MDQEFSYKIERRPGLALGEWELTKRRGPAYMGYSHFATEDEAVAYGDMWVDTMARYSR